MLCLCNIPDIFNYDPANAFSLQSGIYRKRMRDQNLVRLTGAAPGAAGISFIAGAVKDYTGSQPAAVCQHIKLLFPNTVG